MQTQTQYIQVNPIPQQPVRPLRPVLKKNMAEIERLCRLHHVKHLWVFGSVTNEKFNRKSDIDFLVEFEPLDYGDYAEAFFDLCFGLEDSFKRKIDLLTINSVKSPIFKRNVDSQKVLIYG